MLSRGGSFGESTASPVILYAWLVRNLERLIEELRFHGVTTSRLTVAVKYKSGHSGVGQRRLPVPSDRFDLLLDAARPCLRKAWLPGMQATHMHLIAEDLAPRGQHALALFDPPGPADPGRGRRPDQGAGQRPPWPVRPPQRRHPPPARHLSRRGQWVRHL